MPTEPTIRLICCIGVDFYLPFLPHFLRHYGDLGVPPAHMHLIIQALDPEAPALDEARRILAEFGSPAPETWIGAFTADAAWDRRKALQRAVAAAEDWVLTPDIDEFFDYPAPLPEFLAALDRMGVTCAQGPFLDRLSADGTLPPVTDSPDLWQQFPVAAELMLALGGEGAHHDLAGTVKLVALKGRLMPNRACHGVMPGQAGVHHLYGAPIVAFPRLRQARGRFSFPVQVHHFAWQATRIDTLKRRLATPGITDASREYSQKIHDLITAGLDLSSVEIRAPAPSPRPWLWQVRLLRAEAAARRIKGNLRNILRGGRR